jgi:hypothetical protein
MAATLEPTSGGGGGGGGGGLGPLVARATVVVGLPGATPQNISNIIWALAKLKEPPDDALLRAAVEQCAAPFEGCPRGEREGGMTPPQVRQRRHPSSCV